MSEKILITGSKGLIGAALKSALIERGYRVVGFDIRGEGEERGDVRDFEQLERALDGVSGVIHLAAISRVVSAQRDPERCWETNVGGTKNVMEAVKRSTQRPWVLFASSREVYGQQDELPVKEDAPLRPVNIYGRSKREGEKIVRDAREFGVVSGIVRFSNVYGSTNDHSNRVIPAFIRAAALGETLRVEGRGHTFDFVYIDDAVRGVLAMIELLRRGESFDPVHLVTGRATTLGELAELAVSLGDSRAKIEDAPPRTFDVSKFYGDPSRARSLLNWKAEVSLEEGLKRLLSELRENDYKFTGDWD